MFKLNRKWITCLKVLTFSYIILGSNVCAKENNISLEFAGSFSLPTTSDNDFIGVSGVRFDPNDGLYYAVSDDTTHGGARVYALSITHDKSSKKFNVQIEKRINLEDPKGGHLKEYGKVDFESIALLPNNNLILSSEEDYTTPEIRPTFWEFTRDGSFVNEYSLPDRFNDELQKHAFGNNRSILKGCTYNGAFESLIVLDASNPTSSMLLGITEHPLIQDQETEFCRFSFFKKSSKSVILQEEYAYPVSFLEKDLVKGAKKINTGVSDLIEYEKNSYFIVERSYVIYKDNRHPLSAIRVYHTWLEKNTTNVVNQEKLESNIVPMKKVEILDLLNVKGEKGQLFDIYNFEAIEKGPKVDGADTVMIINDNGDNISLPTQFLFFTVKHN